ncbi:MAG: ABC transporter ATP-binding protein [Armatimonadetes bacterium]|nr:ABC transporter ATP-binding protein [Armatimonadota bacterium]
MEPTTDRKVHPARESGTTPVLEARGIAKEFGGVPALKGVDLALHPGEVHALLGENGAGKSTLMNVLYGLLLPDGGEVLWEGRPTRFGSPRDAMDAGIGMVHQHFTLVPTFTVAENLSLGRAGRLYRRKEAETQADALCQRVGLPVDPRARVGELSVGLQQRVEILKALSRNARVLILDEPTGVLAPQEVEGLLALMRRLAGEGMAVVFITHKLAEVERVADRITVLRRGERVLSGDASGYTAPEIARAMVGADLPSSQGRRGVPEGNRERILSVEGLTIRDERGRERVREVSYEIHAGEVLGVAGVEGNGQSDLAEAVTGLRPAATGRVKIAGLTMDAVFMSPAAFIEAGGAHIPEDRRRTGLALEMPIWENLILESHRRPPVRRGVWLDRREARREGETAVADYEIRTPSIDVKAGRLSGGNQQKVVIAREMGRRPRLLVAVNPTRGLDVRAAAYVHEKIWEHRATGGAVLLISTELDELYALSDRIAVMHRGEMVADLPPNVLREELGLWMTRGSGPEDSPEPSLATDRKGDPHGR